MPDTGSRKARSGTPARANGCASSSTKTCAPRRERRSPRCASPPPLVDSPKCTKCSLAGICLPDEVTFFRRGLAPRPLNPSADTALPLYVQEPGARVTKSGEVLVVETEEKKIEVPLGDVSELVLHGPVSLTTPAL